MGDSNLGSLSRSASPARDPPLPLADSARRVGSSGPQLGTNLGVSPLGALPQGSPLIPWAHAPRSQWLEGPLWVRRGMSPAQGAPPRDGSMRKCFEETTKRSYDPCSGNHHTPVVGCCDCHVPEPKTVEKILQKIPKWLKSVRQPINCVRPVG